MKMSIISAIALLVSFSVGNLEAQEHLSDTKMIRSTISEDVKMAAKAANIWDNASLIEAFVDLGSSQIDSINQVYKSVPKKGRVARLAQYLTAKDKIGGIPVMVTSNDLGDFHWGYLAGNTKYLPLILDSPMAAKLVKIESDSDRYGFLAKGEGFRPGTAILIAVVSGQENAKMSATFELGDRKALWTGNPTEGVLKIVYAKTSRGCEIYVNSKPPQATVYFNGNEYYKQTNTSAVREPGLWEVIVHLAGYEEWREKQNLVAGESWTINALLIKQRK